MTDEPDKAGKPKPRRTAPAEDKRLDTLLNAQIELTEHAQRPGG
jgi:hypothetical protein